MISDRFDPQMPLRYVRYGRMSTSEQNPRSPDQQFDEIARVLKRCGYPWVHCRDYRDDGISGRYKSKRHGFMMMLDDIKSGRLSCDLILVDTLERFGRMKDLEAVRQNLYITYGVLILTADSGFADPTSIEGQALGIVETIRSTQDARVKAHNVLRGKRDAAQLGKWPGGPAPLGYRLEAHVAKDAKGGETVSRTLVPNPETAWIAKEIYRLAHEKGWGGARIARHLNADAKAVDVNGRFHADTVNRILRNPIYRGELVFNRVATDVANDRRIIRTNDEGAWVRFENFCEPLVEDKVWRAVNAVREARGEKLKRQRARGKTEDGKLLRPLAPGIALNYELSGLVRCGSCNASMRPNKGGGRSKAGRRYIYFMCPNRHSGSCTNSRYVHMDWLRAVVFGALRRRLFPPPQARDQIPDWFPELVGEVETELERIYQSRQTGERPLLERELQEIDQKIQGWGLSLGDQKLPEGTRKLISDYVQNALERKARIEADLSELNHSQETARRLLDPKRVVEQLHRLDEILANGNPSETNIELARHIESIAVFPDGKVVMHSCKLGLFEGVASLLYQPPKVDERSQAESASAGAEVHQVRPRLLGRRRRNDSVCAAEPREQHGRRPEDPARFEGLALDFFWKDEFQAPVREPWYKENAQEVLRMRSQTGLSLEKLARHFDKSKPTIIKALKFSEASNVSMEGSSDNDDHATE